MSCGSLNENGPPRLLYLNDRYPIRETVREGIRCGLVRGCHWEFKSLHHSPDSLLPPVGHDVQLSAAAQAPHLSVLSKPPTEFFFKNCFGHGISSQQQNRN